MSLKFPNCRRKGCAKLAYHGSLEFFADQNYYDAACARCAGLFSKRTLDLDPIRLQYSAVRALRESSIKNRKGVPFPGKI